MVSYKIYAITDCMMSKVCLLDSVEQAARAGITLLQYRPKLKDYKDVIDEAYSIKEILDNYNIPLIINDYPDVAKIVSAEGVHLGQDDSDIYDVRDYLGSKYIIGLSVGNFKELERLDTNIVDYVGTGSIYNTSTKLDVGDSIGILGFSNLRGSILIPMVAIGGIDVTNCQDLMDVGADGIAMMSGIFSSDNIYDTVSMFRELWFLVD